MCIFISITQFRRMAHLLSLFFSIIMGIMLLVTSSLMVDIFVKYCNYLEGENHRYNPHYFYIPSSECDENVRPFVVLPLFGYFTMMIWVRCL